MQVSSKELFIRSRPIKTGWANSSLAVIAIVIIGFIAWANWAVLEEQVRTTGKIIVSSRSQIVQAVDGGVLSSMLVKEGETVVAGQLLAELDKTRFAASAAETRAKALSLRANLERLQSEINNTPLTFSPEVMADKELVDGQSGLHQRRKQQQNEQRSNLNIALSIALEELSAIQNLESTGDAAQSEILKVRRQVVDLRSELANNKNEYLREAQARLSETQAELEQTLQILKQREEALRATQILAPMSGQVKNIGINTIGAVLRSGDELMQIVPSDEPMLVEARVLTKDIAFVREGLDANIKVDAYDFSIYGGLRGVVQYVSPDTIDTDLQQNEKPYYRALIRIADSEKQDSSLIGIIPGMTSTVEIITGSKTVMEYILKPLKRGSAAAFTER